MKNEETPADSSEASTPTGHGEADLRPGTMLGRLVVTRKLGQGGMGVVYAAYDSALDRKVAIKLLRDQRGSAEQLDRLMREGQRLARLSHPNVVTVHDVQQHLGHVFLSMEFIGNGTLTSWLGAPRSPGQIVDMFLAAGAGIAAAHAAGLIHRDFKPDNVLLDEANVPHVTDFGLAEVATQAIAKRSGTPGFMAPEQARGERVDARADQFSFCVSLYLALYGKLPFPKEADPERPLPLIEPAPTGTRVPTHVRRVIFKGLAEDPNARFASMPQLLAALADDPARRRRVRLGRAAAALSAGVAVTAIAVLLTRETSEERVARLCRQSAAAQVAAMWSPARQGAIQSAFSKAQGGDWWPAIQARMHWAIEEWADNQERACALPTTDAERGRLHHCLEERRKVLASLSDLFAQADTAVAQNAPNTIMLEVQPASACRTTAPVRQVTPTADTLQDGEMRSGLARARVLKAAGKYEEALVVSLRTLDDAADSHAATVEAEAQLLVGEINALLRRADAKPYLEAALAQSEALGSDELRARALVALLGACLDTRDCAVELLSRQADALVDRLGRPPLLEAARLNAVGLWALDGHQPAAAESAFRRCLELRQQHLPKDHPLVARALNNLALTLSDDGRVPVLTEALDLRRRVFGQNHPDTANSYHNLAQALLGTGKCEQARATFELAVDIWKHAPNPDFARLGSEQASLAGALLCLGHTGEALSTLQTAVSHLRQGNAPVTERRRELKALLELMADAGRPSSERAPYEAERDAL